MESNRQDKVELSDHFKKQIAAKKINRAGCPYVLCDDTGLCDDGCQYAKPYAPPEPVKKTQDTAIDFFYSRMPGEIFTAREVAERIEQIESFNTPSTPVERVEDAAVKILKEALDSHSQHDGSYPSFKHTDDEFKRVILNAMEDYANLKINQK